MKPKLTAHISVKMRPALKTALEKQALKEDRSVNWLCGHYLEKGLKQSGVKIQEDTLDTQK